MVSCCTPVEGSIIFHIKTALIDPSDYKRRMRGEREVKKEKENLKGSFEGDGMGLGRSRGEISW